MAYDGAPQSQLKERCKEAWKRSEALFVPQRQHAMLWQSLAEIFYPERADFITQRWDGAERYEQIFDGEPQLMRRTLANNLGAMLRPRGREWFFLRPGDEDLMEDHGVKMWCERATERTRKIIYATRAQFTSAMNESDNDYVAFGNSVIRYTENRDRTGLLFSCAHIRDCAWAENEERVVDELHERMHLSLKQIALMFGKEALPQRVQRALEQDASQKFWVRRCVAPLDQYAYAKGEQRPPRDMAYAALYILEDEQHPLAETYFRVFPYLVRRWSCVSGEAYGRSPAAGVALADARTLNVAQMAILKSVEWAVDPPKIARDDTIVGEIRLEAGGITYVSGDYDERNGEPLKSLTAGDPRQGHDFVDRRHQFLGRAFFQNLLQLPEREMTAYEAGERIEMYVREAAPVFEPMEAENAQLMDGVFERAMYRGAYEDPPEPLQGADVRFEFETPLSQTLKKLRAQQAKQVRLAVAETAALDPSVTDNVDLDAVFRDEMEGLGPVKWLRPKEQVAQMRQERGAIQQEQEQKAEVLQAADLMVRARPETLQMVQQMLGMGGQAAGAPSAPMPEEPA